MTSMEVLSMSGNKLEDKIFFEDGHKFGHMPNLTILELDRNKFTKLPIEALVLHKKLKKMDLSYNKLVKYNPELTELVKLGLDIEYEGKLPSEHIILNHATSLTVPIFRKSTTLQLSFKTN
jgi:Leucine-rich repeat (LRR) protein